MDVYSEVTNAIIAAIEADPGKLVMPWHRSANGTPKNALTGNEYNGVNILSLWANTIIYDHTSSDWASYKQWQENGAQVKKGAKSAVIVFYKPLPEKEGEDRRFVIKYSRVFNASQVEGYEAPDTPKMTPVERLEAADAAITATGIKVTEKGERACYMPQSDEVYIPDNWLFFDTPTSSRQEAFYSTIFHELTHASGHKSRLDRDLSGKFGGEKYAAEEIIAELGAAFCCAKLGITNEPRLDHSQYIANWLQALKNEPRFIFKASAEAQKATTYLLGDQPTSIAA